MKTTNIARKSEVPDGTIICMMMAAFAEPRKQGYRVSKFEAHISHGKEAAA